MRPTLAVPALASTLLFALAQAQVLQPQAAETADLALVGGHIKTPAGWVDSMAVRHGVIVALGDAGSLRAWHGPNTQELDLKGATVLPGFHDVHVHPLFGGMLQRQCRIPQGSTLAVLQKLVKGCSERAGADQWVTGGQWDAPALGSPMHHAQLDAVTGAHPSLLDDTSGHSAWANSRALSVAGVTKGTANPPGGIIERDAKGEPTGVLRESANDLVRRHVPKPTAAEARSALAGSLEQMLAVGITSYTEAAVGFVAGSELELDAYAALAEAGQIKQRATLCLTWAPGDEEADRFIARRNLYAIGRVRPDCVKIFLDGVPTEGHTAAMLEPYADQVAGRQDEASRFGMLLVKPDVLNAAVTRFDQMGLTVKFHAAGDAAVRAGLDAIETARKANGFSGLMHNVGHCTFVSKDDLGRALRIGATLEVSPYLWAPSPINRSIAAAVGSEMIKRVWPVREMLDAHVLVVPGSDWAVVPSVNPWIGIETLVTREVPGGSAASFGKAEAISVGEALDLFTINAARQERTRNQLGELEAGMLGDFIVIDRDPYAIPARELHDTQVRMTFIDGEKVYDSSAAKLRVDVYKGGFATVNSYIFSNGQSQILLDAQRKTDEAKKLAELIKANHLPLTHILISHGHTDHFTGMAYLHREFPDAQIVVANEAIKHDIRDYALYMDTGGQTGAEPALEPALRLKAAANPHGFDYEQTIHVLPGNTLTLDGGGTLEITANYPPTEAKHMATVYSKDLNALFLADFGYNHVHLWMGDDIDLARIAAWREELGKLKIRYAALDPRVYPGHGDPAGMSLLDTTIQYIDDFTRIVSTAKSRAEATQEMTALYPDYRQADFFLKYSIDNHVK
jgi:predicted amidohydrolase YtcJ/glyoxylase-like metal-dependent hydrolase (beta-lactamase superfamily II)